MNETERSGLSSLRDCWITGGLAAEFAPPHWKELVDGAAPEERERLLLAIAGQAIDVAFRPAAPKTLIRLPQLPKLALPMLPERARPLFRAALKNAADGRSRMRVVTLVAARGFVAHPLDWIPAASDLDAPRAYAPWVDWQTKGGENAERVLEALTAENWDDFYPAARRIALADIRRSNPAGARALLEAKAAGETAEARLPLIELLRVNLSDDDAPYLHSLSADRSGKVKQLAARLLARIGRSEAAGDADAEIAELAGFIEVGRAGLLRRRTVYTPRATKSHAQSQRRSELFEACQLIDLASRLAADEAELIAGWQLGNKDGVDGEFARMVVASGSDAAVAQLAELLIAAADATSLLFLLPRLDDAGKRSFVRTVLAGGIGSLHLLNAAEEIEPGTLGPNDLMSTRFYKEIRAGIAGRTDSNRNVASVDLNALGFLATGAAAETIVSDLTTAGLASADPSMLLLRLNAALGNIPTQT